MTRWPPRAPVRKAFDNEGYGNTGQQASAKKIQRALTIKGARLIYALSPCPTGWLFDPSETVEIGRLAVRSGIFPLKEYVDGKLTHTRVMKPRLSVTEYLQRQGRFAHLFTPARNDRVIDEIQNRVDTY